MAATLSCKSKYLSDAVINWEKGSTMPAAPSTVYLALLTTYPTANDGTGLVECSYTGYARVARGALGSITTTNSYTEQASNSAVVTFGKSTAGTGTVVGWAEYDASTSGNALRYGQLDDGTGNSFTQAFVVGSQLQFNASAFTVKEG